MLVRTWNWQKFSGGDLVPEGQLHSTFQPGGGEEA